MIDYEIFELGNCVLKSGATLRNAKLAYKTYGTLKADKSNAIVYPTWYSGQHYDLRVLLGHELSQTFENFENEVQVSWAANAKQSGCCVLRHSGH